jgi:hypothetical protein
LTSKPTLIDEFSWADFGEALKELVSGVVFSTSPIWLVMILTPFVVGSPSFDQIMSDTLGAGILVIYAATTLSSIYYTVAVDGKKKYNTFPYSAQILLATGIIWLISVGLMVMISSESIFGVKVDLEKELLACFSIAAFVLALVILQTALTIRNISIRKNPAKEMVRDTHNFVDEFLGGQNE